MPTQEAKQYCPAMESIVKSDFAVRRIWCPKQFGQKIEPQSLDISMPFIVFIEDPSSQKPMREELRIHYGTTDSSNCNEHCPVKSGEFILSRNGK